MEQTRQLRLVKRNIQLILLGAAICSLLSGCGSIQATGGTTATVDFHLTASDVYVAGFAPNTYLTGELLEFPTSPSSSSNSAISYVVANQSTVTLLSQDWGGHIYTVSTQPSVGTVYYIVNEYTPSANTFNVDRTFYPSSTGYSLNPAPILVTPGSMAADKAGNVYLAYATVVLGFGTSTAAYNNASLTLVFPSNVSALATDANGDLYVQYGSSIAIFTAGFKTSTSPTQTVSLAGLGLSSASAMSVDGSGNIYLLSYNKSTTMPELVEVSVSSSGTPTLVKTISGAATGMIAPLSMTVDKGGAVYVSDYSSSTTSGFVLEYASSVSGNQPPTVSFLDGLNPGTLSGIAAF